jgi:sugar/nucleoside kinase (ribokinase family)
MDFVALGENSVDIVAVGDIAAVRNGKTRLDVLSWLPGGQAATAAIGCARLGWRSRYVGCIGDDPAAAAVESALKRAGVEAVLERRHRTRTRAAVVLVDRSTGNRSVLEYRESNLQLRAGEIDVSSIVSGRLLLVDASDVEASVQAAGLARQAGIPTIVDADRMVPGIERLLTLIDILIVPESFALALTGAADPGEALTRLAARLQAPVVVATLGEHGSLALCQGREIRTAPPAIHVRDTTGAGDAFRAGFAAGWLEAGADATLDQVLRMANAVAALSCREIGAQTGLPTREELAAIL